MLKVGDRAPTFSQHTSNGRLVSLGALAGRPVIIYFFPKAFTGGCTIETKGFRDNYDELHAQGFESSSPGELHPPRPSRNRT